MAEKKPCMETALALLARREHAVKELKTKLLQKQYAASEVTQTLERLLSQNLLSDVRYAHARARYRATTSRWGASRIRQELSAKGITPTTAEEAIAALPEENIDIQDGARNLAKRHQKTIDTKVADPALGRREKIEARLKARNKLLAKLQRKGFSYAEATAAIAEAEAENL